ncbi:MAG: hypothetical protein ACYC5Y_10845 [Symbiobacteriia bacterium]
MKRALALLALLAMATVFIGCGTVKTDAGRVSTKNGKVEFKGNDGSNVVVNDKGEVQMKSADGTAVASLGTGKLPDGYPSNLLPVMEGGTIVSAWKSADQGLTNYSVMYEITAKPEKLKEYYESLLKDTKDFSSLDATAAGTVNYLLTGGRDGFKLSVTIMLGDGGKSVVNLALGEEAKS